MGRNQEAEELPKENTFSQTQLPPGPPGHEAGNGMASSSADWALCPQSADTADRGPQSPAKCTVLEVEPPPPASEAGKAGEDHGVRI